MKLFQNNKLEKGIYQVTFTLTEISVTDQEMLDDREGYIKLNIGGDIMDDDGTTVLLAQGDKFIDFAGDMPIERKFTIGQYGDEKAQKLAVNWAKMVTKRIVDITDEMKLKVDTFTGTSETQLT